MRLWIMSDIHLELSDGWDLPSGDARPQFDVMIVAGDLVPRMARGVMWLAQRVSDRPVIYLPGNHEAYGEDIDRDLEKARTAAFGTNIRVMQNDSITLGGVTFAACTLWTDFALFGSAQIEHVMNVAHSSMNDYRRIRAGKYRWPLRPIDTLLRHQESRRFLEAQLRQPGRHVVLGHHAPLRECVPAGREMNPLSAAYASDMSGLISDYAPELWVYGHTHETRDFKVGSTRVVTNAKGYGPRADKCDPQNVTFDPSFIIQI